MTLKDILMQVQMQYDQSADELDWEDDETIARIGMVNGAIDNWAHYNNTRWQELKTTLLSEPLMQGDNQIKLANYHLLDKVVLKDTNRPVAISELGLGTAFTSGNPKDDYQLNITVSETDEQLVGKSLLVSYYRLPARLKDETDIAELADPNYIVDFVCAMIATDDDPTKFSVFSSSYLAKLNDMVDRNSQLASGERLNLIDDSDLRIGA